MTTATNGHATEKEARASGSRGRSRSPRRGSASAAGKSPARGHLGLTNNIGTGIGRTEPIVVPNSQRWSKDHFIVPRHYFDSLDYVMLSKGQITDRIERLAIDIRNEYGDEEVHVLCILKGSRGFFAELLQILNTIHKFNLGAAGGSGLVRRPSNAGSSPAPAPAAPVAAMKTSKSKTGKPHHGYSCAPYHEHYIRLKSYKGMESMGSVNVQSDDLGVLKGKHVLIVEDIIDTGNTLVKFCKHLEQFAPKTVKVASLLEKRTPKSCGFKGDFIGFEVPDEFIVGYCLDYNEHFRDLDHICVMNKEGIEKYK